MGMFDWVDCRVPLPGAAPKDGDLYQTKSLGCDLHTYVITSEGSLLLKRYDFERDIDDMSAEPQDYTGPISFYADDDTGNWYDYDADFTSGKITRLSGTVTDGETGRMKPILDMRFP